jgi:hypothetical protein
MELRNTILWYGFHFQNNILEGFQSKTFAYDSGRTMVRA